MHQLEEEKQRKLEKKIEQQQAPDWNVVKMKKPIRKLVLASNLIARVIGLKGCNVNAIRDVTGTHIATGITHFTSSYF